MPCWRAETYFYLIQVDTELQGCYDIPARAQVSSPLVKIKGAFETHDFNNTLSMSPCPDDPLVH